MLNIAQGVSLSLWAPDEEILAENLNLRERKYGGIYEQDYIGTTTDIPNISFSTIGDLYGSPVYGFAAYASIAGAGLILDTVTTGNTVPTFTFGNPYAVYDEPKVYGFLAYGIQSIVEDDILTGELTPTFSFATATSVYGDGDLYGFLEYGPDNGFISDPITLGESGISLSTVILTGITYGSGRKYGFMSWQAP